MAGNKRTHQLGNVVSKAGAYIEMDKPGWPEGLKFPANSLITPSDLTNYLNKSSDFIDQITIEAGTDNTPKSMSALRIRQAIEAWYSTVLMQKGITFFQVSNQSSDFTYTIPGNSRLETIDFKYISGTPLVKVGVTVGAEDVLFEHVVLSAGETNGTPRNIPTDLPLFIAVSGGVVTAKFGYRDGFWD
jgi:hypothetical protein